MDPLLEKQLEQAAKRQGVTKSQFIIDAVERALGSKNPYKLLLQAQEEMAPYRAEFEASLTQVSDDADSSSTVEQVRQILEEKHQQNLKDWQAHQAQKSARKS